MENYMKVEFLADSKNQGFARAVIAAFCLPLNPTLSELYDIKTAVSEAVTNSVVHAYGGSSSGVITMQAKTVGRELHITVTDYGQGIDDINSAIEPFFTTRPEDERSGMGFTIMQTFMSGFSVKSTKGKGTVVEMSKKIASKEKNLENNA